MEQKRSNGIAYISLTVINLPDILIESNVAHSLRVFFQVKRLAFPLPILDMIQDHSCRGLHRILSSYTLDEISIGIYN